jgi:CheY-like chemotaxis protein
MSATGVDRPAKRILVVDDEAPLRALIGEILIRGGFRVEFAENGQTAVQKIKTSPPDLVTLDLMMPGMTGWEVIEQVRTLANAPPVVLVSGSTDVLRERHPLRECVAGVVYKPFHPRELVATCEKVLREKEKPGVPVVVERRLMPRRELIMDVGVGSTGSPMVVGKLAHVSQGGAELHLRGPLNAGQVVRLAMRLPGRSSPLVIEGQIQSCDAGGDSGDLVYGISFLNVASDVHDALRELTEPEGGGTRPARSAG